MSKKFKLTINERLTRTVIVEAPSFEDAYDKVSEEYNTKGNIVLLGDDFADSFIEGDVNTLADDEEVPDYVVEGND